jgi:acetyl esterase/lipase
MTEIEYATAAGESLKLDIHRPAGAKAAPVIFYVHGGGWCSGTRKDDQWLFDRLVAGGFVVASVGYRLAPAHRWPACMDDVTAAARWCRDNIAGHGGDPGRMIPVGYSAGGQLALHALVTISDVPFIGGVGLAAPVDKVLDMLRRGGELSQSMKHLFDAAAPDADIANALWDLSPINHLRPGLPATLMVGCTKDTSVPYIQAVHFHQRARAIGLECDLITIDGAGHGITTWAQFRPTWQDELVAWLKARCG